MQSSAKPAAQQGDANNSPDGPAVAARLEHVQRRIAQAVARVGRAENSVTLVGAAKAQPAQSVAAAVAAGLEHVGENYLDDGILHQDGAGMPPACWHFIGPIQSNKTREIAARFDWVQSLDREKIARRLHEQRPGDREPLNVLVQVNVSNELSKAGVAVDEVAAFCAVVRGYSRLRLRGLMAIPSPDDADAHARMAALFDTLHGSHEDMDTLSLGMSGDLEHAIAAGSTMVRVGTDLFGARG